MPNLLEKRVKASYLIGVDFSTWPLPPGASIVGASVEATRNGAKAPASIFGGAPSVDGTFVLVRLPAEAQEPGAYKVVFYAQTNLGDVLDEELDLLVR